MSNNEQWIQKVEVDREEKSQIMFSHYEKPMASRMLIHRESAQPMKSKLNILITYLVRVMRNVSRKCLDQEREEKIQLFIRKMQYSGYSKKERFHVYQKAKQRYEEMIKKNNDGTQPLYRSRNWNRAERVKNKAEKRSTWFRKGNNAEAVFFVDATPNEELAKRCRDAFSSSGFNIKVVEKNSRTVKRTLVKSNPFKTNNCQRASCELCSTDNKLNCKTRDVVYKISCAGVNNQGKSCEEIDYIGETSRSLAERFTEHSKMINSSCPSTMKKSFLHQHVHSAHNGEIPPLSVEIVGRCAGDPSLRQALEAVLIRKTDPCLNRKQEWNNEPRKRKSLTSNIKNWKWRLITTTSMYCIVHK